MMRLLCARSGNCKYSCKAMPVWFVDHSSCYEIQTSRRSDAMGESTKINEQQVSRKRLRNRQCCEMSVSKTGK